MITIGTRAKDNRTFVIRANAAKAAEALVATGQAQMAIIGYNRTSRRPYRIHLIK